MWRDKARRAVLPPAKENIERLEKLVKEGNHYGAQQMYKSISARYIATERFLDALDILQEGAIIQLENGQVTCGAELGTLFVETLFKGKFPCDDDAIDRVRRIYIKFPQIPVPDDVDLADDDDMQQLSEVLTTAKTRVECCKSFLKAAIKWSMELSQQKNGSPDLHDMLAEYIYSESPEVDMSIVSFHFVRGKSPKKFANIIVNFMGKCYPGEDDLAIARAILMYLSLGNLRDANYLMDEIKKQLQLKKIDFPKSDLVQFINYLLQTLQRDSLPLFNMLRQRYKSCLDREVTFYELLDDIAEKFYGVQRRNPLQGMLGDIFKMMGGQ